MFNVSTTMLLRNGINHWWVILFTVQSKQISTQWVSNSNSLFLIRRRRWSFPSITLVQIKQVTNIFVSIHDLWMQLHKLRANGLVFLFPVTNFIHAYIVMIGKSGCHDFVPMIPNKCKTVEIMMEKHLTVVFVAFSLIAALSTNGRVSLGIIFVEFTSPRNNYGATCPGVVSADPTLFSAGWWCEVKTLQLLLIILSSQSLAFGSLRMSRALFVPGAGALTNAVCICYVDWIAVNICFSVVR